MKKISIYECAVRVPYKDFVLVQAQERNEYDDDGKPTGKKAGYSLTVVARDSAYHVIVPVKVAAVAGLTEKSVADMAKVQFDNLSAKAYMSNGRIELSVSADKATIS